MAQTQIYFSSRVAVGNRSEPRPVDLQSYAQEFHDFAAAIRSGARAWLRLAAGCGLIVCLLAVFFTIYPIIDVPNRLLFATKVIGVSLVANLIGVTIFTLNYKHRDAT